MRDGCRGSADLSPGSEAANGYRQLESSASAWQSRPVLRPKWTLPLSPLLQRPSLVSTLAKEIASSPLRPSQGFLPSTSGSFNLCAACALRAQANTVGEGKGIPAQEWGYMGTWGSNITGYLKPLTEVQHHWVQFMSTEVG